MPVNILLVSFNNQNISKHCQMSPGRKGEAQALQVRNTDVTKTIWKNGTSFCQKKKKKAF